MPGFLKWRMEIYVTCLGLIIFITGACVFTRRRMKSKKSSNGVFAAPKHLKSFKILIDDRLILRNEGESWLWSFIENKTKIVFRFSVCYSEA